MSPGRKAAIDRGEARPTALPVTPDGIPAELRADRRCVGWRSERRPDKRGGQKWTKVPTDPRTGGPASSTNPATWASFNEAMTAYLRGDADGVGVVLGDGLAGIDLDDCRDPETGALDAWAAEAVAQLDSYAEVSPSGTGVKVFLRGRLPGECRKRSGPVEAYDGGRYFTLTGLRLDGSPATVNDRQEALEAFCRRHLAGPERPEQPPRRGPAGGGFAAGDAQLLEAIRRSKQGPKFDRLWRGDTSGYGSASEADLALCDVLAFWVGPHPDRIDALFRSSGLMRDKWAQRRGESTYGNQTIARALDGRTEFYSPGGSGPAPRRPREGRSGGTDDPGESGEPGDGPAVTRFGNYRLEEQVVENKTTLVRVGEPAQQIHRELQRLTGGWPKRVGRQLIVQGPGPCPADLDGTDELFAWVAHQLPAGGRNPVEWATGAGMLSQGQLYAYLTQQSEAFDAAEAYPHEPPLPRHLYLHPEPAGGDGAALRGLLARFNPASDEDGELIKAFFLTLGWGGRPGQRPAFMFRTSEGDPEGGRGGGKTTVAKFGGSLFGGLVTAGQNDDFERVKTRLLSPGARRLRLLLLDNVKTLKFSRAELEGLITCPVISGHALYEGEGQRPNTLTVAITLNGVSLSKDLAQRCVIVEVERPAYSGTWEVEALDYVERNRWAILGDLLAALRAPAPKLESFSRWGAWESDVLARLHEPGRLQEVIRRRQEEADDDQAGADDLRAALAELLTARGHRPEAEAVLIPAPVMAEVVNRVEGDRWPVGRCSAHVGTLAIPELRKSDRKGQRLWLWTGWKANGAAPVRLAEVPGFMGG